MVNHVWSRPCPIERNSQHRRREPYVVSAFRRTCDGPAKAGHYVLMFRGAAENGHRRIQRFKLRELLWPRLCSPCLFPNRPGLDRSTSTMTGKDSDADAPLRSASERTYPPRLQKLQFVGHAVRVKDRTAGS